MDAIARHYDNRARVSIEASNFSCEGIVHLAGVRLSDILNEKNAFLAVVDAVVAHQLPGTAEKRLARYDTILIRKGDIKYVVPVDEAQREPRPNNAQLLTNLS